MRDREFPRTWRAFSLAVGAVGVLLFAVGLTTASGGSAGARIASSQTLSPLTVTKVGTVNVAELPAATGARAGAALPQLHFDPAAYAASKQQAGGGANDAGDDSVQTKPSITVGTVLSSPLSIDSPNPCQCTPPDMGLGAGAGFKMEQVNTAGRIWNASNTPGPEFALSSFFLSGGDFISDPFVLFDQPSGRWFAGIFDVSASSERLAVSATSDPTGVFHVYNVPEGPLGGCPDQGKGGVSDNVFALSANEFSSCFGFPTFLGVIITVINKADLLAGVASPHSAQTNPPLNYTSSVVPAQSMNSTTTQWYAGVNDSVSTVAHIVKSVGTPPATVTISEPFTPSIQTLRTPPAASQPSGGLLDTGDNRVQTAAWQSNSLIFPANDACVPNRDSITRSCVRLLAVNTSSGTKTIDKDRSKRNNYYFYPAARPDPTGSIVVGFGRSASSVFPELDVFGSSPTGQFSKPKTVQTGNAGNATGRYGDYFAVAIDPLNQQNVWIAGEVGGHNGSGQNGWGTAVGQVSVTPLIDQSPRGAGPPPAPRGRF